MTIKSARVNVLLKVNGIQNESKYAFLVKFFYLY